MSEQRYRDEFDPETASESEIIERAAKMRGRTLRELGLAPGAVAEGVSANKGHVGGLIERHFRIVPNSTPEPDFRAAGIELKAVPLKSTSGARGKLRSKERTSLTMIGYHDLVGEQWAGASVRKKISAILFVYYHHLPSTSALDYPVIDTVLWRIPADLMAQCEKDWRVVHTKVSAGQAHEISEGDGRVLGAATKGAGGTWVTQPRSTTPAKPRAWAFKASLTTWIREQEVNRRAAAREESVLAALNVDPRADFEAAIMGKLSASIGRELSSLAKEYDVPLNSAKSSPAILIRRMLGLTKGASRVKEFEQFGVSVKTVPVSEDGRPFESMSFPRFDHMKVIDDDWESSDLREHLQRLLIVPLVRRRREEPKASHRLGRVFLWSPSEDELDGIQAEWERYVRLIRDGRALDLPTAAETEFIHVRPKAQDAEDREPAPLVGSVTKKCFWLNSEFVRRIIAANLPRGVLA